MFENKVEVLKMARALASHAGARQAVISRNTANADTPGYRAADVADFASVWRDGSGIALRSTREGHLAGGTTVRLAEVSGNGAMGPNGNSVSLEAEMVKAAETRHQHDMALAIYRSLSGVIRSSLGRR